MFSEIDIHPLYSEIKNNSVRMDKVDIFLWHCAFLRFARFFYCIRIGWRKLMPNKRIRMGRQRNDSLESSLCVHKQYLLKPKLVRFSYKQIKTYVMHLDFWRCAIVQQLWFTYFCASVCLWWWLRLLGIKCMAGTQSYWLYSKSLYG